jgi:hypothetical protein
MTRVTRTGIAVAAAALVAGVAAAVLFLSRIEEAYDRAFDSRVTDPAHRGDGPVVLFDEGHRNTHTTTSGYKPLADLLRNDGYTLRVSRGPLSARELEGVAVLVLAVARGANDANDDPAYTDAECAAIEAWVRAGGSLLLVTDHWPYGSAASSLARRFGVGMGAGLVQDTTHHETERGDSHLVFSAENGLLRDHPIVRGRSRAEEVRRVLTFTGQSLRGPADAVPFLALSDVATEVPPGRPAVQRKGGNVRVEMEYGEPRSAAGGAQGLALEVEAGRLVVLGESGMLRAQRDRNEMPVGMNVPGFDNRQLALNVVHWLSRIL